MCKDSRFITVKATSGAYQMQVNLPLSLKADKADDFAEKLQELADSARIEDGKVIKKKVALIDDLVKVYAVSLGIVAVDRQHMTGCAVRCAEQVSKVFDNSDKKTAREEVKKTLDRIASDNEYCDSFNWKVENRHINQMTAVKTDRHDRVNKRQTQTGNIERSGRVDVRAWCDTVRALTQCKVQIQKVFV